MCLHQQNQPFSRHPCLIVKASLIFTSATPEAPDKSTNLKPKKTKTSEKHKKTNESNHLTDSIFRIELEYHDGSEPGRLKPANRVLRAVGELCPDRWPHPYRSLEG